MLWRIWIRDSYRSKWRMIQTKDFEEQWEADYFVDRRFDLGTEGEAVSLPENETPYCKEAKNA